MRKEQKGRNRGIATRGNKGQLRRLRAEGDHPRPADRQADRGRAGARCRAPSKRGGRIWIRIFPDKPISQKPAEVRMGNGKGNPEYWVSEIKPGAVLYEMDGVDEQEAREAFPPGGG